MSVKEGGLVAAGNHVSPLAVYNAEQWESDGTEDVTPSFPSIKVVQPTSAMPGAAKHGGEFFRSDTEEYYPTLDIVALFKKETRALFEEGEDQPVCASSDGIVPRPGMPLWQRESVTLTNHGEVTVPGAVAGCASCPFSQWGANNEPPPCKASLVVLVDHAGELAQLRISGKSIRPFKRFVSTKLAPRKLPLCSQRLHLYTEERSEPGRKWFELRIDADLLPLDEAKRYNAVLGYERGRFERAAEETHDADEEGPRDVTPQWGDGSQSYAAPKQGEWIDPDE